MSQTLSTFIAVVVLLWSSDCIIQGSTSFVVVIPAATHQQQRRRCVSQQPLPPPVSSSSSSPSNENSFSLAADAGSPETTNNNNNSRRLWLRNTITALATATATAPLPHYAHASTTPNKPPPSLRPLTHPAPLGPPSPTAPTHKRTNLSPHETARRLTTDLTIGSHGRGGYFLSGDLSPDLFRDDCVFEDPTNRVTGLRRYRKALEVLFDPQRSSVELLGEGLSVRAGGQAGGSVTTITGRLRSRGYLRAVPWKPYIRTYETTITYTLDSASGLISRQEQEWSVDATEALRETFTPSFRGPPPRSDRVRRRGEPEVVAKLFEVVNGRRPGEYSREERGEIDSLIERIVRGGRDGDGEGEVAGVGLAGIWILVYLQPGPDGAGIDRRIPFFPEFGFNDSFQVFSGHDADDGGTSSVGPSAAVVDRVTNVGQVLGSLAEVRVSGSLRETTTPAAAPKTTTPSPPPRTFEANIEGGKFCFGNPSVPNLTSSSGGSGSCPIDLPMIQGRGIFESLYLGDRLRIGQNVNGGGARVVQVRL